MLFHSEAEARALPIAPITSIWLALSCSPFLCFHYRQYKRLALLSQTYILLATTVSFLFVSFCCVPSFIVFFPSARVI